MEHHEKLDSILNFLKDENAIDLFEPEYKLPLTKTQINDLEAELRSEGLIKLTKIAAGRYVTLNLNGRNFINSGGYTLLFEEQQRAFRLKKVEKERKRMTKFLYDLAEDNTQFIYIEEDKYGINDIVPKLIKLGLIEINGSFYELTAKGIHITDKGMTVDEFLKNNTPPSTNQTNHNYFNPGNVIQDSTLNQPDFRTDNHMTNNKTEIRDSTLNNSPIISTISSSGKFTMVESNKLPEKSLFDKIKDHWIIWVVTTGGAFYAAYEIIKKWF